MKNPVTVCVGSLDLAAVHSVTQTIHIVDEEEKITMVSLKIYRLLMEHIIMKFIIFIYL